MEIEATLITGSCFEDGKKRQINEIITDGQTDFILLSIPTDPWTDYGVRFYATHKKEWTTVKQSAYGTHLRSAQERYQEDLAVEVGEQPLQLDGGKILPWNNSSVEVSRVKIQIDPKKIKAE